MTITPTTMYWLTRLDGLTSLFSTITVLGLLCLIIAVPAFFVCKYDDTSDEMSKNLTRAAIRLITPIWLFCALGALFLPTTKEMAMIYVVPQITESRVVQQDIPELYDLGVQALKDWLKGTTDEK